MSEIVMRFLDGVFLAVLVLMLVEPEDKMDERFWLIMLAVFYLWMRR